jgi:hypothetical protein
LVHHYRRIASVHARPSRIIAPRRDLEYRRPRRASF